MKFWTILKEFGGWILAGILFLGAVGGSRKWQEKAVDNEVDDVQNDLHQAEVANGKAKEHDEAAHKIKSDAEKEAENVRKTRDILDRFRRS